ncbi:MAG TPA: adenosylmethionine--8-amino-7-oxononanoate transaminase [Nitrospirota bacterium]
MDRVKWTEGLADDDRKFVWHPFTQMRDWEAEQPLVIEKARGCCLYDTLGNKYIDGVSSLWVTVHGHRKKEIDDAVKAQLAKVAHTTFLGLSHPPAIELAKRLAGIAPAGLSRVFYSDNGSTSVEIGVKMAFQYWRQTGRPKKNKFLTLKEAYHGDTIGSVSLGGMDLFHEIFRPLLFNTIKAPAPYCYRCGLTDERPCGSECIGELEAIMRANKDELAAVVMEPLVQGAAGMLVQPPGFLKRVRALCDELDILLVLDEVATGFGRTGRMFACEHEGVSPDILCVAKGITGGYLPLAATITTERVYEGFLADYTEFKTFFHGHTYTANPLACAAALASLDIFENEKTLEKLQPKVEFLRIELEKLGRMRHVGDIRVRGFMAGIELVKNKKTGEDYPPAEKRGHRVIMEARNQGVIVRPLGNVIVLMPPLSISMPEIRKLISAVKKSIAKVTAD